jgi:hypothetical protein
MSTPANSASSQEMAYVERILGATRPERITYLVLTVLSVAILLVSACILLIRNKAEVGTITSLFGSTGIVSYSIGQILRVWTDALKLVLRK